MGLASVLSRRWSFRTCVLLGAVALVMALLFAVVLLVQLSDRRQARDLGLALLRQKLAQIDSRTEALLGTAVRQGRLCLEVTPPEGFTSDGARAALERLLSGFVLQPDFSYLGYASQSTGEYAMLERTPRGELRFREYVALPGGERVIRDYHVVGSRLVPDRVYPHDGYDPRSRPFYLQARAAGRAVWTPSYPFVGNDRRASAPGVTYALPVFGGGGELVGVWDVDFDTLALSAFLRAQREKAVEALVLEQQPGGSWTVLAHPRLTEESAPSVAGARPLDDPLVGRLLDELGSAPEGGAVQLAELRAGGERHLALWNRLAGENTPPWALAVVIPSDFASLQLKAETPFWGLTVFSVMAGCVLLSIGLARLVAKPVERLRAAVEGLTEASGAHEVRVDGPEEVARLAAAYNRMVASVVGREQQLRAANETLEGEIGERRRREAELEAIFAHAPVELWAVDAEGRYTMMSERLRERLGNLRGRRPDDPELALPDGAAYAENNRRALLGETLRGESAEQRGGRHVHFHWILAPVRSHGAITGALGVSLDVTERRRAEDALVQSQQRLKLHLENTPLAVIDWSTDFRVLSWNPAAEAVFGWPAASALGQNGLFLFPPEEQADVIRSWAELLHRRGNLRDYAKNRTRDGVLIDCEWYHTVITNDAGGVIGVSSLVLDVSQRISAERLFLESEQRFVTAFRDSPVAKMISRLSDGRVLDVNERFLQMVRLRREEVVGRTTLELNLWRDPALRQKMVQEIERHGEVTDYEYSIPVSGAQPVDVLISAAAVPLGTELCLLVTFIDHTKRKAAETALRDQEQFLSTLISHLPGMVYRCRYGQAGCALTFVSEGAAALTGRRPETLVTDGPGHLWQCIHPEDRENRTARIAEAFAEGRRWFSNEFRLLHRDGEERWVWERGEGMADAAGQVDSLVAFVTDITDRKRAEEEILKLNLSLEGRVRERTRELAGANEKLKELDRLKSEFLATMSHELRTPLNSIIGFSSLLGQGIAGPLNPEQRKQIEIVNGSARHLLSLINDLLDLSRIESGRVELYPETFEIEDVVHQVQAVLSPLVAQKGLSFDLDLAAVPPLHTDRKRVYQVFLNLANNAVKFTDKGAVRISCEAWEEGVRVSVTDTGIGIREEQLPMLFEAFRQLDGSARRVYEGTGLGLHLCRKLLDLLGGRIDVRSRFGHGSTFIVWLPRQAPAPAPLRS